MDIHSLIKTAGLMAISLSSAFFSSHSMANVNADTNSEDRFWINRAHKNLNKINNFQARTEQSFSLSLPPIISEVTFKKPNNLYQIITHPESLNGFEVSYNSRALILHDPLNKQALKITGLEEGKDNSPYERIKGVYLYNKEHYEQVFTPSIHVAERLSIGLDFIANNAEAEIQKVEGFADYHYSLLMQANVKFNDKTESKIKNTDILFNQENIMVPAIEIPKHTHLTTWDFSKQHLSHKQISTKINKHITWPEDKENTWDFSKHKYYHQSDDQKAAAYYYSNAFFLITTTKPSRDKTLSPIGTPLMLDKTHAALAQFPEFSQLTFTHENIHYTLLANIHPESLLAMAKGMIKKSH